MCGNITMKPPTLYNKYMLIKNEKKIHLLNASVILDTNPPHPPKKKTLL
jgi:hypothetical protein